MWANPSAGNGRKCSSELDNYSALTMTTTRDVNNDRRRPATKDVVTENHYRVKWRNRHRHWCVAMAETGIRDGEWSTSFSHFVQQLFPSVVYTTIRFAENGASACPTQCLDSRRPRPNNKNAKKYGDQPNTKLNWNEWTGGRTVRRLDGWMVHEDILCTKN